MAANYYALMYQINVIVQSQLHTLHPEMGGMINNHVALDLSLVRDMVVSIKGVSPAVINNLKNCLKQKIRKGDLTLHLISDRLYISFHTAPTSSSAYIFAESIILKILNDKQVEEENYSPFHFIGVETAISANSIELLDHFFNKNEIAKDKDDIADVNFETPLATIEYYPLAYAIVSILKEFNQQILSTVHPNPDFAVQYYFLTEIILAIKAKIENKEPKTIKHRVNRNIDRMVIVEAKKENLGLIVKKNEEYILFYHDKYPEKFVSCRDLIIAQLLPYKEEISSLCGYVSISRLRLTNIKSETMSDCQSSGLIPQTCIAPASNSYGEIFSCFQDGGAEVQEIVEQKLGFSEELPETPPLANRFFSPGFQGYIQPSNSAMQQETLAAIYSPPGFQVVASARI